MKNKNNSVSKNETRNTGRSLPVPIKTRNRSTNIFNKMILKISELRYEKLDNSTTWVLLALIALMPVVDIVNSILQRTMGSNYGIGIAFKLFILICLIILSRRSRSKGFYTALALIGLLILFLVVQSIYFSLHYDDYNLIDNLLNASKIIYLPITAIFMIHSTGLTKRTTKNMLALALLINLSLTLVTISGAFLVNAGFSAYSYGDVGSVGWFYSANELSATIAIAGIFLLIYSFLRLGWLGLLTYSVLFIITIISLSTKTALIFGTISIIIAYQYIFMTKVRSMLDTKHRLIIARVSLVVVSIVILLLLPFILVQKSQSVPEWRIDRYNQAYEILIQNNDKSEISSIISTLNLNDEKQPAALLNSIFSTRDIKLFQRASQYENSPAIEKVIGISSLNIANQSNNQFMVEIDLLDILFTFGLLGFLIYIMHLTYVYNLWTKVSTSFRSSYSFIIITFSLLISIFAGHVLNAPSVITVVLFLLLIGNPQSLSDSGAGNKE